MTKGSLMETPNGAIVGEDGTVEIRPTPMLMVWTAIAVALCLFIAIGMPLEQLGRGRMNSGIIGFAIAFGLIGLIGVWFLIFQARKPVFRIDDAGIHRIRNAPYALMPWADISEISVNTYPRGTSSIMLPNGWQKKDGSRSRQKRMLLRPGYLQGGWSVHAYMVARWNDAHGVA